MKTRLESYQDVFYAARSRAEAMKIIEQARVRKNNPPWGAYDESLSLLNPAFGFAYPNGLSGFVNKRSRFGKPVYALHLLGGTKSLRELTRLSGGAAVNLNDFRREDVRLLDKQKGIELISGDVFTGDVWTEVFRYLKDHHRSGFDLIYSSPLLGWDVIGFHPATAWLLLDLAWRVLADDGLILLETSVEQSTSRGMLINFLQKNEIDANEKGRVVILRKKKANPTRLPKTSNWD